MNPLRNPRAVIAGLRGGFSAKTWEVFGELRNLAGEDYIATFSVLNRAKGKDAVYYLPAAPLSAYIGARVAF